MKDTINNLKSKFFLDQHHAMERFSVLALTLLVLLCIVCGIGFKQYIVHNNNLISDKALYNKEFTTSKTGINGKVTGIYTNKDKTKALVLLHFDDVRGVTTNAKNYQMFMTGANITGNSGIITNKPVGSVISFGNTGYIGLYFANNAGFPKQICDIVVRINSELSEDKSKDNAQKFENKDESFKKYDQFTVYANLGAANAQKLESLNTTGIPEVMKVYNETVGVVQEKEIKDTMQKTLDEMYISQNRIKEYENRAFVKNDVLRVPTPEIIAGDQIVKSKIKVKEKNDEGIEKEVDKTVYSYKPNKSFKGAVNFDWENGSISKGYLVEAIGNYENHGSSIDEFIANQGKDALLNKPVLNIDPTQWKMNNGSYVESLNTGNELNDRYVQIKSDNDALIAEWENYYKLKLDFQTKQLMKLIQADNIAHLVNDTYSINTEKNALIVY